MPASVVGDQPVAALDESARALHDVPPRGRQPMQQHDGRPLARALTLERDAARARKLAQDLERRRLHRPTLCQGAGHRSGQRKMSGYVPSVSRGRSSTRASRRTQESGSSRRGLPRVPAARAPRRSVRRPLGSGRSRSSLRPGSARSRSRWPLQRVHAEGVRVGVPGLRLAHRLPRLRSGPRFRPTPKSTSRRTSQRLARRPRAHRSKPSKPPGCGSRRKPPVLEQMAEGHVTPREPPRGADTLPSPPSVVLEIGSTSRQRGLRDRPGHLDPCSPSSDNAIAPAGNSDTVRGAVARFLLCACGADPLPMSFRWTLACFARPLSRTPAPIHTHPPCSVRLGDRYAHTRTRQAVWFRATS